mgnify:CR=1 FL=1
MGFSKSFRELVIEQRGNRCVIRGCGRIPSKEPNRKNRISIHPINGDDTDERLENAVPVCQSCKLHIHRVDEPPYRYWHRQLPCEKRGASHTTGEYEGKRLSPDEASKLRTACDVEPESRKYREMFDIYPD